MNVKGILFTSVVVLVVVLIVGVFLGWLIWSDSNDLNAVVEENRRLKEQVETLREVNLETNGLGTENEGPFVCGSNSDCEMRLRSVPYCCGENLGYTTGCFHINENSPEPLDCTGVRTCPGFAAISGCSCEEGDCQSIIY